MTTITNLLPNPSTETNQTDAVTTAGATVTRGTTGVVSGVFAMTVATTGTGQQGIIYRNNATALPSGGAYVGGVWVSGSGALEAFVRMFYVEGGSTLSATATFAATGTPTRVATNVLTSDAGKTISSINLYVRTVSPQTVTFYTDAAMVVQGDVLPAYFDGDSPGARWTGTPHASTSVLTLPTTRLATSRVFSFGERIGPLKMGQKG